ncbi:MAG: DUF805 domain-containing protein [Candidatus Aquilonibacter sp.]
MFSRNTRSFRVAPAAAKFWWYTLINAIIGSVLAWIGGLYTLSGPGPLAFLFYIYVLATMLPYLGVTIRRLHDTDRSGWWILIDLVPFVGWIVLIVFYILEGTPGENRYGPPPNQLAAPAPSSFLG